MAIGDHVLYHGRRYRLRGIDPMSVSERQAELEDLETGERVRVPLDEVEEVESNGTNSGVF
jgi:hypothetical protein